MAKKDFYTAVLFLSPSLIGFSIFYFLPFLAGIYYSLINNPLDGRFVGLANYGRLFANPVFLRACLNTALFTLISVPANMALSLGLALLLNKSLYGRGFWQSAFLSPLVVPVASVVLVWLLIFDLKGVWNHLLTYWGLGPVDWLNTAWARVVVLIVYLWKNAGYNMVIFLAGLRNIPELYYEVAKLDGAGSWHRFRHITLVYLTPTIFFVFIISIINSFKVFRETYLITGAYPHQSIYLLQHFMNNSFLSFNYQNLATAAVSMALLINIFVYALYKMERKLSGFLS